MNLISKITKELKKSIDFEYKKRQTNFFKLDIVAFGVRVPEVRKIANRYFSLIKNKDKKELFDLCNQFFKKQEIEYFFIASHWLEKIKKQFEPKDFTYFENCIKKYVSNWATCDDLCTNPFGYFLYKHPQHIDHISNKWPLSQNKWLRRGAAVSLIYSVRKNRLAPHTIFSLTDNLLHDQDDMVQKGYGWLLKVLSKNYKQEVFNYVMKYKNTMPRTALRYAIEKMPKNLKSIVMKK